MTAPELSLIGHGGDIQTALQALADEIDDFAGSYFERFDYFRHTVDSRLAPFLLRFVLSDEGARRELLLEPLREGEMPDPAIDPRAREQESEAAAA